MNQAIQLPTSDCLIYPQMSLAPLTSYRVGGNAQWYSAPKSIASLQASLEWQQKQDVPLTILGAGSNLLIGDSGLEGLVVNTRYLRGVQIDEETGRMTADAGEPLAKLAWKAAKRGWRGLEWAVGIPGSVGGSIVMNAGAHNRSVADVLASALILTPDGSIESLIPDQLNYSYRTSNLQKDQKIVLQATFQLQPDSTKAEVMAATEANLQQRKNSQPYHLPSCGSVFRNPKPKAAGWLIEQLGLKGYQIGGAQVAHRHANFILNCGNAKANDIFQLICHIQERVHHHWSISLEPEVKTIGEFS
jgi:UDP-N-acetylmuramate dehydrogenase